jgi:GNAT superfamily N-acetyltransferase
MTFEIVRPASAADSPAIAAIAEAAGLFPAAALRPMIAPYLDDGDADMWLVAERESLIAGFAFARAEMFTDGTWNKLAIGVLPERQGGGIGRALTSALEGALRDRGARVLIAETSSAESFSATRCFYARAAYVEVARLRDFWTEGDDKVVFWKRLG